MTDTETALRTAIDHLEELVYVCQPDGTLIAWNDRLETITGHTAAELDGVSLSALVTPDDRDLIMDALDRVRTDSTPVSQVVSVVADSDEIPYELSFVPLPDEDRIAGSGKKITQSRTEPSDTVRSFTMPVVEIWDGIVLSPIVGKLDSEQAERYTETLLEQIVEHEATIALIDITGVQSVDTQTAQHLIDTIQAVDLLGAEVIITGVNPDLARTLVKLGIGFEAETRASLIDGLQTALTMQGVHIEQ